MRLLFPLVFLVFPLQLHYFIEAEVFRIKTQNVYLMMPSQQYLKTRAVIKFESDEDILGLYLYNLDINS